MTAAGRRYRRVVGGCALALAAATVLPTYEYSAVAEPMWYGGVWWPVLVATSGIGAVAVSWLWPRLMRRAGLVGGVGALAAVLLGGLQAGATYVAHATRPLSGGDLLISAWPLAGAWLAAGAAAVLVVGATSGWRLLAAKPGPRSAGTRAGAGGQPPDPDARLEWDGPLPSLDDVVGPAADRPAGGVGPVSPARAPGARPGTGPTPGRTPTGAPPPSQAVGRR